MEGEAMMRPVQLGMSDPSHALVLQTCKRPVGYLDRTLISLRRGGLMAWPGPRVIVSDGYDPRDDYPTDGWDVVKVSEKSEGQARTFLRALLHAHEMRVSRVTIIEDDVMFAREALRYIACVQPERDVFLSAWFTLYPGDTTGRPFWHVRSMREFARNQAITLSAETLATVTDDDRVMGWGERSGADQIFGKFWPDKLCALHYPNPVQHVGDESSVGDQGRQVSPSFVGEDFNASVWL